MSTVNIEFYLVIGQSFDRFGRRQGKPTVRAAKNKPDCRSEEIAVALTVNLPESLFKRPNLRAEITVLESSAPAVITPEIQENIARVVQEQLGITMTVNAPPTEAAHARD